MSVFDLSKTSAPLALVALTHQAHHTITSPQDPSYPTPKSETKLPSLSLIWKLSEFGHDKFT